MSEPPTIRLIPRSGPDPDWRDDVNQRLADRIERAQQAMRRVEAEWHSLRGRRDLASRSRRIVLRRRRRDLVDVNNQAVRDLHIGLMAALRGGR
jgi:hypothetical protein